MFVQINWSLASLLQQRQTISLDLFNAMQCNPTQINSTQLDSTQLIRMNWHFQSLHHRQLQMQLHSSIPQFDIKPAIVVT